MHAATQFIEAYFGVDCYAGTRGNDTAPGAVAAGVRRLGKGMVFHLGANSPVLPFQVLEWLHVKKTPIASSDRAITAWHYVSNNGLYDLWFLWNTKGEPVTSTFTFREGSRPAALRDANTGAVVALEVNGPGAKLANVVLGPWETRGFLSPRGQIARAPAAWFARQRDWWSGTADSGPPIPAFASKVCVNLTEDWAYKILDGHIAGDPPENLALADPQLDDSSWQRMRIGVYNVPDNADARHVVFRKTFRVPEQWDRGRVCLFTHGDVRGKWRRYLDGKPLQLTSGPDDDLHGVLKPGSTHCLVVEMWGADLPAGTTTPVFRSYRPNPAASQPIKDGWSYAADRLTYGSASSLPLTTPAAGTIRTTVTIDAAQSVRNVLVHVEAGADGAIVNGHWAAGFSNIYHHIDVNVTPWVRFGQDNEVIVVFHEKTTIGDAWLDFYDKDVYP